MKTFSEIKESYENNILPTYPRYPVAFTKGAGSRLWDTDGKEYIDFASGVGVNSVGHSHPKWVEAVTGQAAKLVHVSNLFYTEPGAALAEKINKLSGLPGKNGIFFCNSGAESVEGVIKAARKYSNDKYGPGRHTIITLKNSFHGRTIAALTATGQEKFHKHFYPFVQGFRYVPANDFAALEAEANTRRENDTPNGDICAIMLELIQGEGGIIQLDAEYVQKAVALCEKNDWLLICDEVQTGIGRTGAWFAFQNYGIKPDAVCFAKGIAGGLPFGGFLLGDKMHGVLNAGDHGSTYGGNLLCCAAALAVLEILAPILPQISEKGAYIREKMAALNLPQVKEIRGAGLMIGIQLESKSGETPHTAAVKNLLESGLVALSAGADVLRFLPPLTTTMDEINEGLAIIEETLKG